MTQRRRCTRMLSALGAVGLVVAWAARAATRPARASSKSVIVLNGEGNNLNAYTADPAVKEQNGIRNHDDHPNGLHINAHILFFPDASKRFIAGEDTGQPNPPQGWGIFRLNGSTVGKLSATKVGKLTPTYQSSADNAENYGCGFLKDGRVLTTDIGNQA